MSALFKKAVHDHLEQRSLSEERLQQIMSLESKLAEQHPQADRAYDKKQRLRFLSFAMTGVAAFIAIFLLTSNFYIKPVAELIAADVAENHINLKPADIKTNSMEDIRQFFDRLDFLPVRSRLIAESEWELIGGRYCSIQSKSAAQLRIRNKQSQKLQTFYQVTYAKGRFHDELPSLNDGEKPLEVLSRGLKVKIWTENEFVFAMTDE